VLEEPEIASVHGGLKLLSPTRLDRGKLTKGSPHKGRWAIRSANSWAEPKLRECCAIAA